MPANEMIGQRRSPVQERAKDRVANILAATDALLAEVGLRDLKLSHVARRAGVPIGSIYQYFPNRDAILRALVDERHARFTAELEETVGRSEDFPAFVASMQQAFDRLAASYRNDGALRQLWSGAQGFAPLRALDVEDTMRNAAVICRVVCHIMPGVSAQRAMTGSIMLCETAGSLTRLATELEPDAEARLMAEAKVMMADYLINLFNGQLSVAPGPPMAD